MLLAAAAAQNAAQRSHDLLIKAINFAQKPGAGRVMQVVRLPALLLMSQRPEFGRVFMVFIKSRLICSTCSVFSSAHILLTCAPAAQIRDPCYFSQQNAAYLYNGRPPICMRCSSLYTRLF
jgi:hypothetical protein